jgi:16S rRNA (uracil1498-N3)-methyltransferase
MARCEMSNRFYFEGVLGLGEVTLEGPEAHHLAHVRRFDVGEEVTLFNGDGHEYAAGIEELGKKKVRLNVVRQDSPQRELSFPLHIAAALPKADRTDFLIEKLTELGVTSFTPLHTERSVVKVDAGKVEKFRRAVIEASKQCGRNVLMEIHDPSEWHEWHALQTTDRWLANPSATLPLHKSPTSGRNPILVAFGPEGGFTSDEIAQAVVAGWHLGSLGPRVLRIETAALAAVVTLTSSSFPAA